MKLGYFVRKSSKKPVIEGVKHLKRYYLPNKKLICNRTPFDKNCNNAIKRHADARVSYTIPSFKINNFLAASSLSHLLDGWMYLSNSISALLNGDSGACIHLAYYAELRSTMSILATEGVGVFDRKHLGVFNNITNSEFPKNYYKGTSPNLNYKTPELATHVFVWEAIEKWSKSSVKPDTEILKIFKVKGHSFFDLIEFFHPIATPLRSTEVVKEWLQDWCFDIRAFKNDRENRNLVSYRPQRIRDFERTLDFKIIINDLTSLWSGISPAEENKFNLLDMYLLRKLFHALYVKIAPSVPIRELIETAFESKGITDNTMNALLCMETPYTQDHLIFQHASNKELLPLPIIARAMLLLRIAVGMVSQLYKLGDVTTNELGFVWSNYGLNNGFWTPNNPKTNFNELWTDIQSTIIDLKEQVNGQGSDNNLSTLISNKSESLTYLSQISRACLWGIDL